MLNNCNIALKFLLMCSSRCWGSSDSQKPGGASIPLITLSVPSIWKMSISVTAVTLQSADQSVFHDPVHPSAVILPVLR